jgi:hypothetical protein
MNWVSRLLYGADDMTMEVLAYVQRKRITDWKRLVLARDSKQSGQYPTFLYGSNDDRVFSKMPQGSVLWIVSSLPAHPPTLVAKLNIDKVRHRTCPGLGLSKRLLWHFREFKWIAKGTSDSEFFGHNNAGPALIETVFESSRRGEWTLCESRDRTWKPKFGLRLQRPTEIAPWKQQSRSAAQRQLSPLEKIAASSERSIFVSWKWRDHSKKIPLCLAYELANRGHMVWLDHLALPDSRALRKVQKDKDVLERLLRYGYRRCSHLLILDSEHYGEKSSGSAVNWTLRELQGTSLGKPEIRKLCFQPSGVKSSPRIPNEILRLKSREPVSAAIELSEILRDERRT